MDTTELSAERWTEIRSLDLLVLMDDTSAPIVSRALADLIAEVERLRAELAEEEHACAERGRYLAEVDAALIAAGQDEAGGYIAYPRRIQQLAGEARFWHFEYREAMDNYKDEAAALRDARAELATARAAALYEGAARLEAIADAAEAKVRAYYGGACGEGSCDMVREAARTLRDMATSARQ